MKECFECGSIEDLNEHHVVPRSRGGTKTITLCYSCHCKAHGRDAMGLNHRRLVSEGVKAKFARDPESRSSWGGGHPTRRKKAAANLARGRQRVADEFALGATGIFAWELREKGSSLKDIAKELEDNGYKTAYGKTKWYASSVSILLKRHYKLTKLENK